MVCGQTLKVCSAEVAAFCGLVLVFGSKLVSCDAAGLPFGMVSEPRRRLEPTLAGGLVEYLAVKMYFRVSAESFSSCAIASLDMSLVRCDRDCETEPAAAARSGCWRLRG